MTVFSLSLELQHLELCLQNLKRTCVLTLRFKYELCNQSDILVITGCRSCLFVSLCKFTTVSPCTYLTSTMRWTKIRKVTVIQTKKKRTQYRTLKHTKIAVNNCNLLEHIFNYLDIILKLTNKRLVCTIFNLKQCWILRNKIYFYSYVSMFSCLDSGCSQGDTCRCTSHHCWHKYADSCVLDHMDPNLKGNTSLSDWLMLTKITVKSAFHLLFG